MTLVIFHRDSIRFGKAGEVVDVDEPLASQVIASGQAYPAADVARAVFRKRRAVKMAEQKQVDRYTGAMRELKRRDPGSDPAADDSDDDSGRARKPSRAKRSRVQRLAEPEPEGEAQRDD